METTDQGMQGDWIHLMNMMEANAADLAFLDVPKGKLAAQLAQAQDINKQQDTLTASKQEASKQYRLVVIEGQRLANAIRKMIKSHYGIRSEKLAEFGLQPCPEGQDSSHPGDSRRHQALISHLGSTSGACLGTPPFFVSAAWNYPQMPHLRIRRAIDSSMSCRWIRRPVDQSTAHRSLFRAVDE